MVHQVGAYLEEVHWPFWRDEILYPLANAAVFYYCLRNRRPSPVLTPTDSDILYYVVFLRLVLIRLR